LDLQDIRVSTVAKTGIDYYSCWLLVFLLAGAETFLSNNFGGFISVHYLFAIQNLALHYSFKKRNAEVKPTEPENELKIFSANVFQENQQFVI
jgi:hypothetical protein